MLSIKERTMKTTFHSLSLLFTLSLALCAVHAGAQVNVVFTPNTETGAPGDTLNYSATFTDTDTVDYYIDGVGFTSLNADPNLITPIFNGAPAPLGDALGNFEVTPNESVTVDDVFSLALDPTTPDATYTGTVSFTGQDATDFVNGTGTDAALGSADIAAQVVTPSAAPEVPESSSLMLIGLGLTFLLVRARHKQTGIAL
jgi:hypothetical protein